MKVSVVITSYNQEDFLPDAIESVLRQTVLPHEIIICDDLSTKDNSREIIKAYVNRYPDLIKPILQGQNLGIAANRNSGFKAALGEYITWLDGDDRFLPEKIQKELEVLRKNTWADIAYSNIYYTDEKLNRIKTRYKPGHGLNGNIFKAVATRRLPPPAKVLLCRKCFSEVGFMDETLKIYEDWEWMIRLASNFSFTYCPEPLYEYRQHPEGIHNIPQSQHIDIKINIARRAIDLCDNSMIPDKEETKRKIEIYLAVLLAQERFISGGKTGLTAIAHKFRKMCTLFKEKL
jgi:glycosyltransferase involved in cell wall biosynthesis